MSWRGLLGGGLLAAYAGLTAVLCRVEGVPHILVAAAAGGCLGFGLLFAMQEARGRLP